MKNKFFSLLILVLVTISTQAQTDLSSDPNSSITNFNSVGEAAEIARDIIKAAGKRANFEIRKANVPNAAAVLYGDKRYILYNPDFISKLNKVTGTQWAAISVLAHEIGHHLNRQTVNGKISLMATELQADEFSGFVLQKLGATIHEAQAAMKVLGSIRATRTHPSSGDRLNSIALGYQKAGGSIDDIENDDSDIASVRTERLPVIDSKSIVAEINFDADPDTKYFVTTRMNVVKVSSNKLYMIGKIEKLDDGEFPFVMYDASKIPLFVSNKGKIVNQRGSIVGKLSPPST